MRWGTQRWHRRHAVQPDEDNWNSTERGRHCHHHAQTSRLHDRVAVLRRRLIDTQVVGSKVAGVLARGGEHGDEHRALHRVLHGTTRGGHNHPRDDKPLSWSATAATTTTITNAAVIPVATACCSTPGRRPGTGGAATPRLTRREVHPSGREQTLAKTQRCHGARTGARKGGVGRRAVRP